MTQTSNWINTLNPFLFRFPESWGLGQIGIRWYGLAYLTGFIMGGAIIAWLSRRNKSSVPTDRVSDFVTAVAIGTMVGGRLGYCLFYQPSLFWTFRSSFPFWDALAVHEGGMASHGGIAGIAIACIIFGRLNKIDFYHLFDLSTLGGSIGIFCGRIANFINGELIGRPAPEELSWAVKFPQDILNWNQVTPGRAIPHLTELESLTSAVERLGIPGAQWADWLKLMRHDVQAEQAVGDVLHRLVEATQNGGVEIAQLMAPTLTARYPSQLIEAGLEGLFLFLALMWIWRLPRKPGVVAAWFVTLYAIVRVIGEQFRMPDAHIGFQALGLTRGQWISLGMLVFGLTIMYLWSRRDVRKVGGWMVPETAGKAGPEKRPTRSSRR